MTRGRGARSWAAALTGLVLLGGCTTEVAGSPTPAGTPGADGYGDPYFPLDGNGGYDVDSYALDLRVDPGTDALSGTATVVATATQRLSSFNLDLLGFAVSSVTVDGEEATVTREAGELTVTPTADVAVGAQFTTVVTYEGVPEPLDDGLGVAGFIQTEDGALAAGQPDSAASWFPVNDHPADAATVDVSITVPEGLEAISNGELVGSSTEDGETTWQWSAREPMAPYLVTLAVGEFELEEYESDGIRYWDAIDPVLADYTARGEATVLDVARESLARAPEVIAVLEEWFGPYPFGVAGGIVDFVPDMQFALETQTRPVYSPNFFTDADSGEVVVVHELAHQWAGDSVRLAGWQHIWLNEGFATYAEWLWADAQGTATPQEFFDELAEAPADRRFWQVAIGDPGPATDDLFSQSVYLRGAMTLHALRLEIGEDAFAELVLEWFDAEAGQAVTTADFVALAEEVSGAQLDEFFAEWLGEGKPAGLG